MQKDSKIFIAGHKGMVGSAILRKLTELGYTNIITVTKKELNLQNQEDVRHFFWTEKPEYVFLCAAKVGGIKANSDFKADFIYDNIMIQSNIIHSAKHFGVKKLLFLGSSCIYPKLCPQPIKEEYLLTGSLEPTNDAYSIAKIAGIKMCQSFNEQYGTNFISVMPTNLYGYNDNYDLNTSHVLPALLRKFHEATNNNLNQVEVWGTGRPKREFLHVDDMAAASIFVANVSQETYESCTEPMLSHINVGTGVDCTIAELALTMAEVVGYQGNVTFDATKPDGAPRKLMNVDTLKRLGWSYSIELKDGLASTYEWFLAHQDDFRG